MKYTIRHEVFYSHPVADVWEFLTTPELIAQWLMPNDFQPLLGHEFAFRTKPLPQLNLDGVFHCRVLEVLPMKKLSYSWKGGPGDGTISLDTLVVWTLDEEGNGTWLRLVHSGFDETTNMDVYKGMTEGWSRNMQKIVDRLNNKNHDTKQA